MSKSLKMQKQENKPVFYDSKEQTNSIINQYGLDAVVQHSNMNKLSVIQAKQGNFFISKYNMKKIKERLRNACD